MNDHLKDKAKEAFDLVASKQPQKTALIVNVGSGVDSQTVKALHETAKDSGYDVTILQNGEEVKLQGFHFDQVVVEEVFIGEKQFDSVPRGTLSGKFTLELSNIGQDSAPEAMNALREGETPMFENPENWEVGPFRGKWMLFKYKGKAIMRLCKVNRPLHAKAFGIPPQQYHYNWQSVAPGDYCVPVGKLGLLQKTCNIRDAFVYAKDEAKRRDIKEARKK